MFLRNIFLKESIFPSEFQFQYYLYKQRKYVWCDTEMFYGKTKHEKQIFIISLEIKTWRDYSELKLHHYFKWMFLERTTTFLLFYLWMTIWVRNKSFVPKVSIFTNCSFWYWYIDIISIPSLFDNTMDMQFHFSHLTSLSYNNKQDSVLNKYISQSKRYKDLSVNYLEGIDLFHI